jgi:carboxymethylenebutenolidase
MPVAAQWIRHENSLGFLAWPERAHVPLPSVLVIQEIWGVDEHIKDVTRRIASAGYVAYAPDLFAKDGVRPEALHRDRVVEYKAFLQTLPTTVNTPAERASILSTLPEPARSRLTETHQLLFGQLRDLDKYLPALEQASGFLLRTSPLSSGQKLACVGFSMGGGLAGLLATAEPGLSGTAIFYGTAPPLDRVPRIASPLIGFYAGLDERVNAGIPPFAEALAAAGKPFERHIYPGAKHGFFNEDRPAYDANASRDAFARLIEFFRVHLSP